MMFDFIRVHHSDYTAGIVGCLKRCTKWTLKTIKKVVPNVGHLSLCRFEIMITRFLARSFGWYFQLLENERCAVTITNLMSSCDQHVKSCLYLVGWEKKAKFEALTTRTSHLSKCERWLIKQCSRSYSTGDSSRVGEQEAQYWIARIEQ